MQDELFFFKDGYCFQMKKGEKFLHAKNFADLKLDFENWKKLQETKDRLFNLSETHTDTTENDEDRETNYPSNKLLVNQGAEVAESVEENGEEIKTADPSKSLLVTQGVEENVVPSFSPSPTQHSRNEGCNSRDNVTSFVTSMQGNVSPLLSPIQSARGNQSHPFRRGTSTPKRNSNGLNSDL
eukprot:GHVP01028081.1.p1 GENE.GHVP01028081.1~~GHVP01028081.1.p1  ORF type:complete len:183 (+),score=51.66 GHVP01028081.1:2-550(+)